MVDYREGELVFEFPTGVSPRKLDWQDGRVLPTQMKFIDFVLRLDDRCLLVEVKDPANSKARSKNRTAFVESIEKKTLIKQHLTPKVRGSYLYEHLMERDDLPFVYVVLIGLDFLETMDAGMMLTSYSDALHADVRGECWEGWSRDYISECVVLDIRQWNNKFVDWPVRREPEGDD